MPTAVSVPPHVYNGARVLVSLHAHELTAFVQVWRRAEAADLALPVVGDKDYATRLTLLRHVLGAARHYITWCCEKLDLPRPEIEALPDDDERLEDGLDAWVEQLLERWSTALVDVPEEAYDRPTHTSAWGVDYCIDAMLEHAVMHPVRHRHQLLRWLREA